jgi:hypothetical protein
VGCRFSRTNQVLEDTKPLIDPENTDNAQAAGHGKLELIASSPGARLQRFFFLVGPQGLRQLSRHNAG